MSKTITLRISEERYEAFKKYARQDNRKISNAIETLALRQLESAQFASDAEMEGILADKDLRSGIEKGAKQGKDRKGRLDAPASSRKA
jgi:hypothetical protein